MRVRNEKNGIILKLYAGTMQEQSVFFLHLNCTTGLLLKLLITDFTTNNPTVIVGSHNFSKPASVEGIIIKN